MVSENDASERKVVRSPITVITVSQACPDIRVIWGFSGHAGGSTLRRRVEPRRSTWEVNLARTDLHRGPPGRRLMLGSAQGVPHTLWRAPIHSLMMCLHATECQALS